MRIRTHRFPGLVVSDHEFRLPLDHGRPEEESVSVYAREVVSPRREADELPWLVFLQGGPGFGAPRPTNPSGWLKTALERYRVLLLDQRGTGRSSRVCAESLARFATPELQAEYLSHFRSDAIVQDLERIRAELTGGAPWTLLGQSYGGFCAVHYLSAAPEGLAAVLITGGLPPLDRTADEVYQATYARVLDRNRRYYERYPDDVDRIRAITKHLETHEERLPGGARLTPRLLQPLGLAFGMSDGFETVHYLVEEAWVEGSGGAELGYYFRHGVESAVPFQTNPIFAVLHEAIYGQGVATSWSAERVRAEFPQLDPGGEGPFPFTGEMIYPWMFDEYPELVPLRDAAHLLAAKDDWSHLYDREALSRNGVPVVAAVYADDMYVERRFSEETAERIANTRIWLTNEYDHNGLRADGARILTRLLDLLDGQA